ncbi:MAG: hypothetical protein ABDI19_07780 [Armatimonadota bacterium]
MASEERRFQIGAAGFWLIGLGLLVGLWRVWEIEKASQQALGRQLRIVHQLTRFQQEASHCERLVATLSASQSESVRAGGFGPAELHRQLKAHFAAAQRDFHTLQAILEPLLQQQGMPIALRWAAVRVEMEWLQLGSSIQEYLARDDPSAMNLETLHAFGLKQQDGLYHALESLQHALSEWHAQQKRALNRQQQLVLGFCGLMSGLLIGWLWYFALRPASLMHRWLHRSGSDAILGREDAAERVLQSLRGTCWEPVARRLVQQHQRLREVEQFIRDLAMGRTPEPLHPLEPHDPLARSSFWLIRRFEEYRRAQSSEEAV